MTTREAMDRAERMGLSAWTVEADDALHGGEHVSLKRVGFERIDLVLGEAALWEDALAQASHLIFSA